MVILVTAAAGRTGRAAVRALAARGVAVRALVRRPEQAAHVRTLGAAEVVVGDLRERAALRRAAHGIRGAYLIAPHREPEEAAIAATLLGALREAGAGRVLYHSVLRPQAGGMPPHTSKLYAERTVVDSGLATTIIQPAPYMQNLLVQRYDAATHGVYRVPYSVLAPFSWVDLRDVAEAAATVLVDPGHDGATYELAGPEQLNSAEVAERWGEALGRSVRAETLRKETWARDLGRSGVGGFTLEAMGAEAIYYNRHGLIGNPNVLAWLLGRRPRTLTEFFATVALRPDSRRTP